jgi:hypothetical protein
MARLEVQCSVDLVTGLSNALRSVLPRLFVRARALQPARSLTLRIITPAARERRRDRGVLGSPLVDASPACR